MFATPRSVAICFVLLFSEARELYPQASPSVQAGQSKKQKAVAEELQRRYEQSHRVAKQIAAARRIDATGYQPPGSPSYWIGREGQLLAPVEYDDHGIRKPAPTGAAGIRGFPS